MQVLTLQFFRASASLLFESEPRPLGLPDGFFHHCRRGSVEQLPAGCDSDSAAATEVDYARHDARDHALHLCYVLPYLFGVMPSLP